MIVVKLQNRGMGPPGRESVVSEEQKKQMMLQAYRRQEELKVSLIGVLFKDCHL